MKGWKKEKYVEVEHGDGEEDEGKNGDKDVEVEEEVISSGEVEISDVDPDTLKSKDV